MAHLKGSNIGNYVDVAQKVRWKNPIFIQTNSAVTGASLWCSSTGAWRYLNNGVPTDLDADGTALAAVSGAQVDLGNLSGVAFNADIDPAADNQRDFGHSTKRIKSLYLGTSLIFQGATRKLSVTASEPAVADRTINYPDPGGDDSVAYVALAQTLTNKTFTSPVLTTPQINDTSADHQYVFAVSELAADRTVTLPLLAGDDEFVFKDFAQTLTNKTISGASNTLSAIALTSLANAGGAQGDVLYWSGAAWTRLAAGTSGYYLKTQGAGQNPAWDLPSAGTASALAQTVTAEAGAFDYTLHFHGPAAARHLDVIDPLADDVFVFASMAQTLVGKTLTAPKFADGGYLADANGNEVLQMVTTAAAVDHIQITPAATANPATVDVAAIGGDVNINLRLTPKGTGIIDFNVGSVRFLTANNVTVTASNPAAARVYTLPDAGGDDSFVYVAATQTLTGKTLTSPVLTTPQINDTSADHQYVFAVSELAGDRNVTLPLLGGNDEFVFKDHAVTLTNKTLAAGSNTITGLGTANTDHIAATNGTHGLPFVLIGVNSGALSLKITDSAPVKFRVLDAWAVATKACNGNWKLQDNALADITTTVSYGVDKAVTRAASIDDGTFTIAAGADLYLISSDAADTAIVYVMCVQVD